VRPNTFSATLLFASFNGVANLPPFLNPQGFFETFFRLFCPRPGDNATCHKHFAERYFPREKENNLKPFVRRPAKQRATLKMPETRRGQSGIPEAAARDNEQSTRNRPQRRER